jgi:hypothetical protein
MSTSTIHAGQTNGHPALRNTGALGQISVQLSQAWQRAVELRRVQAARSAAKRLQRLAQAHAATSPSYAADLATAVAAYAVEHRIDA